MPVWVDNLRCNRKTFKKSCGWAAEHLQGRENGKTSVIMGASPAIKNQVEQLKMLQFDSNFCLCGLTSNLEFLLTNGIYPKYIVTMDGDKTQGEFFETIDMAKTKNITLIANCYAYPPMLRQWQGPLYFIRLDTSDKYFSKMHDKCFGSPNGCGSPFPSMFASYNIMAALAVLMLESSILLFVGNEMSFKDDDSTYYVDRKDPRDKEQRFPHGDIYGNKVYTTLSLLAVKYALEGFLEIISQVAWYFNCTEAGIFGITKKYPDYQVPWVSQLTLTNGIAQARHIMRTGQPLYC